LPTITQQDLGLAYYAWHQTRYLCKKLVKPYEHSEAYRYKIFFNNGHGKNSKLKELSKMSSTYD